MNENKTYKTLIFEWASLATLVLGSFLFLHNQINNLEQKIERQCGRTDKLYEMFIDLIKENKK